MTMFQISQGDGSEYIDHQYAFTARMDSVKILSQLLKCISFREYSTWFISSNGIKVTVEDAKCVQSNAFIKSNLFQEFHLKTGRGDKPGSDDLSFSINLRVVLECLNCLSLGDAHSSPCVKICYAGYGHPLILLLEDHGVISDSQIKTREAEECLDFNFASANVVSKVIMCSELLKEMLSELDITSEFIEFNINPEEPNFCIKTSGPAGDICIKVPNSSDMVEHFSSSVSSSARYKLSLVRHGIKPLGLSDKVSVRMDDRDFLCIQFMVKTEAGPAFLEYYCAPEEDSQDR